MRQALGASPLAVLLLLAAGQLGCDPPANQFDQRATMNSWAMQTYMDPAVQNAVIAQHTLFPYHFDADSSALNELGEHDVAVLAAHFRQHPGEIGLRRGDTAAPLYQARLAAVNDALVRAGVDSTRVKLADGFAGGAGLYSERCLVILGWEAQRPVYPAGRSGPLTPAASGGPPVGAAQAPGRMGQ